MGDEARDNLARFVAGLDQLNMYMPHVMQMVKTHYDAAVEAGFAEEEAQQLTLQFHALVFSPFTAARLETDADS
jgi:hypothetical protein